LLDVDVAYTVTFSGLVLNLILKQLPVRQLMPLTELLAVSLSAVVVEYEDEGAQLGSKDEI